VAGTPASGASRARLVQLLTPAVAATGHDLEDLTVSPAGKRRVVRVLVDNAAGGGITLDDVAQVSRVISDVLDAAEEDEPELLGGAYVLEVSSPGVDRPLTLPRHWVRNVSRLVKATLADSEIVIGRVQSADDLEVTLDVDGTARILPLAQVVTAHVQVEFSRTAEDTDDEEEDA
jgi:ribosome maturation factor RimP